MLVQKNLKCKRRVIGFLLLPLLIVCFLSVGLSTASLTLYHAVVTEDDSGSLSSSVPVDGAVEILVNLNFTELPASTDEGDPVPLIIAAQDDIDAENKIEIVVFSDIILLNGNSNNDIDVAATYSAFQPILLLGSEALNLTVVSDGNITLRIDGTIIIEEPYILLEDENPTATGWLQPLTDYTVVMPSPTTGDFEAWIINPLGADPTPTPAPTATPTPTNQISANVLVVKTLILLGFAFGFIYKIYNTKDIKDIALDMLLLGGLFGAIIILFI